jgi:hypothetical protein
MSKIEYWILTCLLVLSVILFGIVLSVGVRRLPDVGQPTSSEEVWIYKDHPIFQQITLGSDNFNVITVYMRNVGLRNKEAITFALLDINQKTVRQINLNGYNIGDGDNVRFQFDPIPDSAGKTYTLKFSSPTSVYSNAVGIGYSQKSISYQTYYLPMNKIAAVYKSSNTFIQSFINPKFLIVFVSMGLASVIFSKLMYKNV